MTKSFMLVILGIFFIGFILSSVIRLIIYFREVKANYEYHERMTEKLDMMNRQMAQQVANVHETMDIIHNDYNRMVKSMRYDDYSRGGYLKGNMDRMLKLTAEEPPAELPDFDGSASSSSES